MENLQGDGAVVPDIAGQVDGGHAAAAELALEYVAVGQGDLETFWGLAQSDLRNGVASRLYLESFLSQSPPPTATVSATASPGRTGHFVAAKRAPMLGK
jgi:hypothetical protein